MLGKLIKQEFKASSRSILFVFLGIIIINLLGTLLFLIGKPGVRDLGIIGMIMVSFIGVFIVIALLANRFYQNFYKSEGYLMFTLPVRTESLLFSKLLTATIWVTLSGVLFLLTAFWLVILGEGHSGEFPVEIFSEPAFWTILIEIILIGIVTVFTYLTIYYFSITLVNIFSSGKVGPGVGFILFLGILFFLTLFEVVLLQSSFFNGMIHVDLSSHIKATAVFSIFFAAYAILSLAISSVFFFVTSWLMKKKINLK